MLRAAMLRYYGCDMPRDGAYAIAARAAFTLSRLPLFTPSRRQRRWLSAFASRQRRHQADNIFFSRHEAADG